MLGFFLFFSFPFSSNVVCKPNQGWQYAIELRFPVLAAFRLPTSFRQFLAFRDSRMLDLTYLLANRDRHVASEHRQII